MRITRPFLLGLLLGLVLLNAKAFAQQKASTVSGIQFHQGTWASVLAEAKKQNKPFFVDFYAVWCGPCKYMTKVTFADPALSAYSNAKFIAYKLDGEEGEGIALSAKHKVQVYPTYVFFAPDGSVLGREEGAMDAPTFLKLMQAYADKANRRADSGQRGMKTATPAEKASLGVLFQKQ
jgi:thiol:disulfide interchange protein